MKKLLLKGLLMCLLTALLSMPTQTYAAAPEDGEESACMQAKLTQAFQKVVQTIREAYATNDVDNDGEIEQLERTLGEALATMVVPDEGGTTSENALAFLSTISEHLSLCMAKAGLEEVPFSYRGGLDPERHKRYGRLFVRTTQVNLISRIGSLAYGIWSVTGGLAFKEEYESPNWQTRFARRIGKNILGMMPVNTSGIPDIDLGNDIVLHVKCLVKSSVEQQSDDAQWAQEHGESLA